MKSLTSPTFLQSTCNKLLHGFTKLKIIMHNLHNVLCQKKNWKYKDIQPVSFLL